MESVKVVDDEESVTVTEIIITVDGMEWMEGSPENEDGDAVRDYYENNIENVLDESSGTQDATKKAKDDARKAKKHKSRFKEEDEDPFITVEKFWSEHSCAERCTSKFTQDEVVQLRSSCEALDEYVDGTNRLDLVILAMIRALVRTKKVRNRAYKVREERKSANESQTSEAGTTDANNLQKDTGSSQKERQKYTCNFMVEGQTVCRTFFLFVHNIGVKRWGRLMKVYKSEGLVEKYHGLCNRKPANTTPLEHVQFVVQFLRKYCAERATTAPIRLSNQHSDVKVLPLGESKSSVYDKYVTACRKKDESSKVVSKISFNRIWRQCCPNLLTQKPRTADKSEKPRNGHSTVTEISDPLADVNDPVVDMNDPVNIVIEEIVKKSNSGNDAVSS